MRGNPSLIRIPPRSAVLGFLLSLSLYIYIYLYTHAAPTRNFVSLCIRIIVLYKYRKLGCAESTHGQRERGREKLYVSQIKVSSKCQLLSTFSLPQYKNVVSNDNREDCGYSRCETAKFARGYAEVFYGSSYHISHISEDKLRFFNCYNRSSWIHWLKLSNSFVSIFFFLFFKKLAKPLVKEIRSRIFWKILAN